MGLSDQGEVVDALLVDDGHEQRMIRRMRAAVIGRIVQEGVATRRSRTKSGASRSAAIGKALDEAVAKGWTVS
jgi:hypothetical protein